MTLPLDESALLTVGAPTNTQGMLQLVLVGGGPSSATVLMRLADRIAAWPTAAPKVPLRISVVDTDGEPGGGVPFAREVSPALLLNDCAGSIDGSGIGFLQWLDENRAEWLHALAAAPDARVVSWLRRHGNQLRNADLSGMFLPRPLLGNFLRRQVASCRRRLADLGVEVEIVTGRVSVIRRGRDGGWLVELQPGAPVLAADAVLLGIGSPARPPAVTEHPGYLTHAEATDVTCFDQRMPTLLRARPGRPARVVVLGSAAAASEVLYLLESGPGLLGPQDEITVLSPSGLLPEGLSSALPGVWRPTALHALADGRRASCAMPTARDLVDTVVAELTDGKRQGYQLVDLLSAMKDAFNSAFARLSDSEKQHFVESEFARYRTAIRHTSPDYARAAQRLRQLGMLVTRRAAVTSVAAAGSRLEVGYRVGTEAGTIPATVVFDCRGFATVNDTSNPLVARLLTSGIATPNRSGRGLQVNERFEAAPGLFVLGPLLAGTACGTAYIWSLENVPRISTLAERVAEDLLHHLRSRPLFVAPRGLDTWSR